MTSTQPMPTTRDEHGRQWTGMFERKAIDADGSEYWAVDTSGHTDIFQADAELCTLLSPGARFVGPIQWHEFS